MKSDHDDRHIWQTESRKENDAEHSWHLALDVLGSLREYANEPKSTWQKRSQWYCSTMLVEIDARRHICI